MYATNIYPTYNCVVTCYKIAANHTLTRLVFWCHNRPYKVTVSREIKHLRRYKLKLLMICPILKLTKSRILDCSHRNCGQIWLLKMALKTPCVILGHYDLNKVIWPNSLENCIMGKGTCPVGFFRLCLFSKVMRIFL